MAPIISTTNNINNNIVGNGDYDHETLVYDHKLSSVGPARVTGDVVYDPSDLDLAMKLHYLRIVYFLDKKAVEGLTIMKIKEAAFAWLCYYYESCGRFRRSEINGRPYIKCNDCGVRFVEAKSSKTLEDWLQLGDTSSQKLLVSDHVLGPELVYSPIAFLQITYFKCGGVSVGLSMAHVLGDAFSASHYMNSLAQFLKGQVPTHPPTSDKSALNTHRPTKKTTSGPISLKQIGPIGDHWAIPNPCEMDTFSFHVTSSQLSKLQMDVFGDNQTPSPAQYFEALCSVIWQAIAKVGTGPEPNAVTVIKHDRNGPKEDDMALTNSQVISSVKAHLSVVEAHPKELATLIRDSAQDERAQISEIVGQDPGGSDLIVYGSNPTFVDLGEAGFYGFEIKGLGPRFVNCFVDGIGEGGVVLVLPSPKNGIDDNNFHSNGRNGKIDGRIVTLILPHSCMEGLKQELKKEWSLIV